MKAFFGAAILAAAIVGGVVWRVVRESSAQESARQAHSLAESTSALDDIAVRLTQIEDRLESLETESSASRRIAASSVSPATARVEAESEDSVAKKAPSALPSLKGMNEADIQDLRALIAEVYVDERNQRRQREKEEAELAARERAEMMLGPYGDQNYRVNSLGKKLGLSDYQKSRYHEALLAHHQRLKDLRNGVNFANAASRESWNNRKRGLDDDFQTTVVSLLSADQAATYEGLDEGEKSAGNATAVRISRATHLGENGEVMTVDFMGVGEGAAGLPLPPPEVLKGGEIRLPLGLPGGGGVVTGDAGEIVIEHQVGAAPEAGGDAKAKVIQVKPRP